MLCKVTRPLKCGSFEIAPGESVKIYPRRDCSIHLQKDGRDFILGPFILKYLSGIEYPTLDQLIGWSEDVLCESPTGHLVEHDGTGPDGFHSWFRYLGYL